MSAINWLWAATGSGPSGSAALPTPPAFVVEHMKNAVSYIRTLPALNTAEWCMILLPVACYWTYSALLWVASWMNWTSLEIHKIPTDQKMRPQNRVTVSHVLRTVAMQHILQTLAAYCLAISDGRHAEPDSWTMGSLKLIVAACMLDTYQYWMHRLMHSNRFLYRHFHSVHHELTQLYAFGALYNHPIEGFLMDTIGSGIPALILNMHPWTSTAFFTIATIKTVDDHCGYVLPWDPLQRLFRNNAEYHDIHHWGKGRMYNFSQPFFTYWDIWMGTDYQYANIDTARQASEKQAALKQQ